MKKLLSFLLVCGLLLASALQSQAQTTKFYNRNFDERIGTKIVTTDSTLTYIDSATVNTNEGGIYEVTVIGFARDTAYSVTGKLAVRYNKRRGTLTMGSIIEQMPVVTDAALGSATFTIVAANDKLYVRVKGKADESITWVSITKRKSISTVL